MRTKTFDRASRPLTGPGVTPAVRGALEVPDGPGPHAAVILLPGSSGWHDGYPELVRSFAAAGFVALAVDYLAETGPEPTAEERERHWPLWQAIVGNAITFLQGSGPTTSTRSGIGLVGYSLGAFLAVSVASALPGVGAVVDFFGGGGESLRDGGRGFPPLLILHGDADHIVPVSCAHELREAVLARCGEVEMHLYPAADHAFNAPWTPWYSEPDAADSWTRTIDFLARRLRVPPEAV